MFNADIATTKLRSVSFTTQRMMVDHLRFTSFAIGCHTQHTLIFLPCLRLHNVLYDLFQPTCLEFPISASLLMRKHVSCKVSIKANRLVYRHSKPAKHERYDARSDKHTCGWTQQ